jgi:hypothetical protein
MRKKETGQQTCYEHTSKKRPREQLHCSFVTGAVVFIRSGMKLIEPGEQRLYFDM